MEIQEITGLLLHNKKQNVVWLATLKGYDNYAEEVWTEYV
jgi:hypothetical protein